MTLTDQDITDLLVAVTRAVRDYADNPPMATRFAALEARLRAEAAKRETQE